MSMIDDFLREEAPYSVDLINHLTSLHIEAVVSDSYRDISRLMEAYPQWAIESDLSIDHPILLSVAMGSERALSAYLAYSDCHKWNFAPVQASDALADTSSLKSITLWEWAVVHKNLGILQQLSKVMKSDRSFSWDSKSSLTTVMLMNDPQWTDDYLKLASDIGLKINDGKTSAASNVLHALGMDWFASILNDSLMEKPKKASKSKPPESLEELLSRVPVPKVWAQKANDQLTSLSFLSVLEKEAAFSQMSSMTHTREFDVDWLRAQSLNRLGPKAVGYPTLIHALTDYCNQNDSKVQKAWNTIKSQYKDWGGSSESVPHMHSQYESVHLLKSVLPPETLKSLSFAYANFILMGAGHHGNAYSDNSVNTSTLSVLVHPHASLLLTRSQTLDGAKDTLNCSASAKAAKYMVEHVASMEESVRCVLSEQMAQNFDNFKRLVDQAFKKQSSHQKSQKITPISEISVINPMGLDEQEVNCILLHTAWNSMDTGSQNALPLLLLDSAYHELYMFNLLSTSLSRAKLDLSERPGNVAHNQGRDLLRGLQNVCDVFTVHQKAYGKDMLLSAAAPLHDTINKLEEVLQNTLSNKDKKDRDIKKDALMAQLESLSLHLTLAAQALKSKPELLHYSKWLKNLESEDKKWNTLMLQEQKEKFGKILKYSGESEAIWSLNIIELAHMAKKTSQKVSTKPIKPSKVIRV